MDHIPSSQVGTVARDVRLVKRTTLRCGRWVGARSAAASSSAPSSVLASTVSVSGYGGQCIIRTYGSTLFYPGPDCIPGTPSRGTPSSLLRDLFVAVILPSLASLGLRTDCPVIAKAGPAASRSPNRLVLNGYRFHGGISGAVKYSSPSTS